MSTDELLKQIIPLAKYEYREGFSNHKIVDTLNEIERADIESKLINLLQSSKEVDNLIVDTLAYMKSKNSLVTLKSLIKKQLPVIETLSVACAIYEIDNDESMIDLAIKNFEKITDNYTIMASFYYLFKFNNDRLDNIIKKFLNHEDYLVSYNAKRFIDLRTSQINKD
jgi:hypothetical protein